MARILTLTNWFPPHSRGGYEAVCRDVMHGLAARGHEIEVLCSDELLTETRDEAKHPFPVHRDLQMYWRDGKPWAPSRRRQVAIERANQQRLRSLLESMRPDVVSVWHMGALSLNLLTTLVDSGIPLVYAVHDDWLTYGLQLDPWGQSWSSTPVRRAAGRIVQRVTGTPAVVADIGPSGCFCFVSAVTQERNEAASPWRYPHSTVVHAGIDRSLYPEPDEFPPRPWTWKLLFMGRLDPRKGTDTLLRSLARLPTAATLSMVGPGEPAERARLEGLARQLGVADRVAFSWVSRQATRDVYLNHDCLVFPSEWDEPFGLVPLEAMACGVPVVATGAGGSSEFLEDDVNCALFPAGDAAALAQTLQQLARNGEQRLRLRKNGWVSARQFDVDHMTEAYERIHLQTVTAGPARQGAVNP
jgi:glycosyltransferase involved in cell wall biosynthesis